MCVSPLRHSQVHSKRFKEKDVTVDVFVPLPRREYVGLTPVVSRLRGSVDHYLYSVLILYVKPKFRDSKLPMGYGRLSN